MKQDSSNTWVGRGAALLGITALVALVVWVGLNLGGSQQGPPPLWTEADLPAPPPADLNGWTPVAGHAPNDELQDKLANLPVLTENDDDQPEASAQLWQRMEESATDRRFVMREQPTRELIAHLDEARARPQFQIICPLGGDCPLLDWHALHDLALGHALGLALDGAHAQALELATDLVRIDRAHFETAISWLSVVIALSHLEDALRLADALLAHPEADPDPAALDALRTELAALELETPDLGPVLIGEYVLTLSMIDQVMSAEAETGPFERPRDLSWTFDLARTRELLDARYEQRHVAASHGDLRGATGADEPPIKDSATWWLRNAAGKIIASLMLEDALQLGERLHEDLSAVRRAHARLRGRPALAPG